MAFSATISKEEIGLWSIPRTLSSASSISKARLMYREDFSFNELQYSRSGILCLCLEIDSFKKIF